jgi:phosphopantothenoylcysteine decarboxylase/phosphopantothenate--cysteine ligase
MYTEVYSRFADCDVIAMTAAVADARPAHYSDSKIKKGSLSSIELAANKDIIASVAKDKKKQIVIAFAAETSLDIEEGERKLFAKSADILYLNDVSGSEIFGSDETQGVILTSRVSQSSDRVTVERISKDTLADLLLDQALSKLG